LGAAPRRYLYEDDPEFTSDCLAFALATNNIRSSEGTNHWLPFTADDVHADKAFASPFMADYIRNINFSPAAKHLLSCLKELFTYYHTHKHHSGNSPNDAGIWEIRAYFQGTRNGNMLPPNRKRLEQQCPGYMPLIDAFHAALRNLRAQIAPNIPRHGFLK